MPAPPGTARFYMGFGRLLRPVPPLVAAEWHGSSVVLDVVYLVGGCAFFVVAVLYAGACERL